MGIKGNEAAGTVADDSLGLPSLFATLVYQREYNFPIRRNIMNRWDQQVPSWPFKGRKLTLINGQFLGDK